MKKLLLFAVSVAFVGMANAQDCTALIDGSATTVGLNPNPPAGSVEGIPYDEVNTLVIPGRVNNTLTPNPIDSIPLCLIAVQQINGMPPGYSYDVWAYHAGPGSQYDVLAPAGTTNDTIHIFTTPITRVCIRLKNPTPPASSDMGDGLMDRDTAVIQIVVGAWADLGAGCADLSSVGGRDTFEVRLPIKDAVYAGIVDEDNNGFVVGNNSPNPANDITYLNFTTPTSGELKINMYDAVGRNVYNFVGNSVSGKNTFGISTTDLNEGVYIYSITYGGKTVSKKLIVNR